jgi:hypothetical protein
MAIGTPATYRDAKGVRHHAIVTAEHQGETAVAFVVADKEAGFRVEHRSRLVKGEGGDLVDHPEKPGPGADKLARMAAHQRQREREQGQAEVRDRRNRGA